MDREGAIVAGVVAALASTGVATSDSEAATLHTQGDFVAPADGLQFLTMVHAELHRPCTALLSWGAGPSVGPGSFDAQFDLAGVAPFDTYSLLGVDDTGGVLVSFFDPGIALGESFENLFPGFSEAALADALINDPTGPLVADFIRVLDFMPGVGAPMGSESALVHFSAGAAYGSFTASFNPIPAPSAGALLLASMGVACARRRRAP